MQDNSFDEVPIRDTIKLLHDKLSLLFYLDNVKSPNILQDIDSSISKCSDFSISSCAEIIIPPIIMALHNCIENKHKAQLHQINENRCLNYNSGFDTKYSLQIEELLKILLNVLQKIKSKASKIVFSRISMAFFDILHVITKTLQTSIHERNEFIIEICIKIAHLDFNIFWEYWQHKDNYTNTNKHLIIPVIVQFLLRITIPNKDEIKYSKDIRVLSLKLLSELPSIINNSDFLMKVYPGVIQKLSIMVINSISEKGSTRLLEMSVLTMIEWIDYCLCDITPGTIKYNSNMENIKNTAKILNYIIKYKTIDLDIYNSSTNDHINPPSYEVYMITVKRFFFNIANKCVTQLFDIFHDCFVEILITSLDFLISIKCDDDQINALVDNAFNSIFTSRNDKIKLFLSNYLNNFLISFERMNMDKLTFCDIDRDNNLEEFVRILTKYIGFQKVKSKYFQNILPKFCPEEILKILFRMLISHRSLTLYDKYIKDLNKTCDFKYQNSSIAIENFNLRAIDITENVKNYLINEHSDNCTYIVNKDTETINNFEVFQLYGDLFTSIFFNNKRLGFEKSKLISGLIIKSISISILNLSVENTDYRYIFDCSTQCFQKLNTKTLDEFDSMLDFIVGISLCNATQLILRQFALGNSHYGELPNFNVNKLPNIITNWFEFALEELKKDLLNENHSNKREINRNIILIFMGNLLFIAREIELESEVFIKKFNKVIIQLISLYGYGSPITKQIVTFILNQIMQILGHFTDKFSINSVIKEYSVEIIRSLEMMCYRGYSKEKVYLILTALEHCKLEFILELSDIIERFSDINANNNHWIFEFVAIITKRLSAYIVRHWSKTAFRAVLKNHEISLFKHELESFQKNNFTTIEVCYAYIIDYLISQGINELNISHTESFIVNDTENQPLISLERHEDHLLKETGIIEISSIRKIIKKVIHIIYPYISNIDGKKFSIFDHQYLSTYSLINCIFILSTERSSLYPFVNMIIPTLINQWTTEISKIRTKELDYFKTESIKSRELYLTNQVLIQLIVSSGDFAIKTLEDKLIPLITEYIEFVFLSKSATQLMDDKGAEVNSEFQELCISVMEVLYTFTKFYLKLNIAEVKFEILNCIINLLLSPINSSFSIKWRNFVSKTILHIYFKFPSIINSRLATHRKNSSIIHMKETIKIIKLVESSFFSTFKRNSNIISETQGELNLRFKINNFDSRVAHM